MATPTNRPSFDRKKVLPATATIEHPNLTPAQIDAGARVCYESFVRDVWYANCTRFVALDKLKEHQKPDGVKLAEEVVEARGARGRFKLAPTGHDNADLSMPP